ncbi:shikimate dehydrogenase [Gillisia sp. Hel_I_86]|uniref:shikimate dehydrogenase family protein n=1 Tax=Gillisia sp. Hel_I_86 TaxID=1249981 RepID=UPI00119B05CF|nr:shikimate dehydrogenase [Gillisia sp. Hel_I_86]TVZ25179.1 shikimate dehydrogenase [Gillisia sp. Hel_I_86]
MKTFGLIGKNIDYSFSRTYFNQKFSSEKTEARYKNFDLIDITEFPKLLKQINDIKGFNVTIPYKEVIIPYLDEIDDTAREIGAVNTIKIKDDGKLIGYNTDFYGFSEALKPYLKSHHTKALILGTGGASKAVSYALQKLGIPVTYVSRSKSIHNFVYSELTPAIMEEYNLIVNCTPLGTFPNIEQYPPIPTRYLTPKHLVFDLIYNPSQTKLMKLALNQNAKVTNGLGMLEFQAEKAWEIWNQ